MPPKYSASKKTGSSRALQISGSLPWCSATGARRSFHTRNGSFPAHVWHKLKLYPVPKKTRSRTNSRSTRVRRTTEQTQDGDQCLSSDQIRKAVAKRLKKYNKLNLLEHVAMFMGVAQIFELSLKGFVHRKFDVEEATMVHWPLGRIARVLRDRGLRPDFCTLLDNVVRHRNYIAHELLANEAILRSLAGNSGRLEIRHLEHGTYELEQIIYLYEWTNEHEAW